MAAEHTDEEKKPGQGTANGNNQATPQQSVGTAAGGGANLDASRSARGYDVVPGSDAPSNAAPGQQSLPPRFSYDESGTPVLRGATGNIVAGKGAGNTATPTATSAAQTSTSSKPATDTSGMEKIIAELKAAQEDDEHKALRERAERRRSRIAAVGDLLGAMHRSYAYMRGVQPMELPNLSEEARERVEKAKAERDKNRDALYNYTFKRYELETAAEEAREKAAANKAYREAAAELKNAQQQYYTARAQQVAAKTEDDRAKAQVELDALQAKIDVLKTTGDKNEAEAAYTRVKTEMLPELTRSQINRNNASANNSNAHARTAGRSGSGGEYTETTVVETTGGGTDIGTGKAYDKTTKTTKTRRRAATPRRQNNGFASDLKF